MPRKSKAEKSHKCCCGCSKERAVYHRLEKGGLRWWSTKSHWKNWKRKQFKKEAQDE